MLETLETFESKKNSLRRGRGQGGFTLIELLIVIVILAILAAIVVFAVGSTTKNAIAASCNSDAKSVETAISAYQAQNPAGLPALTPGNTVASEYSVLTTAVNGNGPWLRSAPSSTHYQIFFDASGAVYALPYTSTPTTPELISTAVAAASASNNVDTTPTICGTFQS